MTQKLITDFQTYHVSPVSNTTPHPPSAATIRSTGSTVHPNHIMQDNSMRVNFDMVSSGELGEMEKQELSAIAQFPESTANELSKYVPSISIRTITARISDIFQDKKNRFSIKLFEACPDRKDLITTRTATPWRLSRRPHYYTKSELIKFIKWTPAAITQFLQYPDETCEIPPNNSLNAPLMQLYLANRGWATESTEEYKAYQKERKNKRNEGS